MSISLCCCEIPNPCPQNCVTIGEEGLALITKQNLFGFPGQLANVIPLDPGVELWDGRITQRPEANCIREINSGWIQSLDPRALGMFFVSVRIDWRESSFPENAPGIMRIEIKPNAASGTFIFSSGRVNTEDVLEGAYFDQARDGWPMMETPLTFSDCEP